MWHKATLLCLIFQSLGLIEALGENCRGGSECRVATGINANYLSDFNQTLSTTRIDNSNNQSVYYIGISALTFYRDNNIICKKAHPHWFCLFLQGDNIPATGVNGTTILQKLANLIDHGCHVCGSVPLSDDNDPNKLGVLTSDYEHDPTCDQRIDDYCNYGAAPDQATAGGGGTTGAPVSGTSSSGSSGSGNTAGSDEESEEGGDSSSDSSGESSSAGDSAGDSAGEGVPS